MYGGEQLILTVDNLIIILVVTVLFMIFRYFDRTNKSMEKVRKFAATARAELEQVFFEQRKAIKDDKIDLEENYKRGRVILEKIKNIEKATTTRFNSNAEQLTTVLENLDELQNRYDAIRNIHQQSQQQLEQYTSANSALTEQFNELRASAHTLNILREQIPQLVHEQQTLIAQQSDKHFADREQKMEALIAREKYLENRLHQLENEKSTGLSQQGDAAVNEIKRVLAAAENQLNRLGKAITSRDHKQREQIKESIKRLQLHQQQQIREIGENYRGDVEKTILQEREQIKKQMSALVDETLRTYSDHIRQQVENFEESTEQRLQVLASRQEGYGKRYEKIEQKFRALLNTAETESRERFAAFTDALTRQTELLEERGEVGLQEISEIVNAMRQSSEEQLEMVRLEYEKQVHTFNTEREDIKKLLASEQEHLQEITQKHQNACAEQYQQHEGVLQSTVETLKGTVDDKLAQHEKDMGDLNDKKNIFAERFSASIQDLQQKMDDQMAGLISRYEERERGVGEYEAHLNTIISQQRDMIIEQCATIQDDASEEAKKLENHLNTLLRTVREQSETMQTEIHAVGAETEKRVSGISRIVDAAVERAKRIEGNYSHHEERIRAKLTELIATARHDIDTHIDEKSKAVKGIVDTTLIKTTEIDTRIKEFQVNQNKIIDIHKGTLEKEINQYITSGCERLQSINDQILKNTEQTRKEYLQGKHQLDQLATSFVKNKQKALARINQEYENKIQRQIDYLQSTVNKYRQRIDQQCAENDELLRTHVRVRFDEINVKVTHEIEGKYSELKTMLHDRTGALDEQWADIEKKNRNMLKVVEENESHLANRQYEYDNQLLQLQQEIKERSESITVEMSTVRADFDTILHKQIGDLKGAMRAEVDSYKHEFTQQVNALSVDLNNHLEQERDKLLQVHTSHIANALEDNRRLMSEQTEKDRLEIHDWQQKTETGIKKSKEEMREFQENLSARITDAFNDFNRRYDSFQYQLEKRSRELASDAEERILAVRDKIFNDHEEIHNVHKGEYDKIEQRVAALKDEFSSISKKQKEFNQYIAHLNKTAEFQETVLTKNDSLQHDLSLLMSRQKEIKSTQRDLENMREITEKIRQNVNHVHSERHKIERFEKNWSKMKEMASSVEQKLVKINKKDDWLQDMQQRIRTIEELNATVSEQYHRLEDKHHIAASTLKGIDDNFQQLENIDEKIQSIQTSVDDLPGEIDTLRRQIDDMSKMNTSAQKAKKDIKQFQESLTSLEQRMQKISDSQEWLGRTETRLQDISNVANKRLVALQSLVGDGASNGSATNGGISDKRRETIINLAEQHGWNAEQIAKQMKISVGEVEVILGLLAN